MKRCFRVVASVLVSVLTVGSVATAAEAAPRFDAQSENDAIEVVGTDARDGLGGGGERAPGRVVTTYVPACAGNSPDASAAEFGLCPAAITMCAGTPEPNDVLFWRFTALRAADGSTGPWQPAGQACLRPQDVPTGAVPAFTAADFRRLPLPASTLHVQPATGRTLVAVPTNLYAAARPQTFDVTLLGLPVRVRATPTAWTWTYGDGTTATRTVPGGPYPDLSTAHTFTRPGRYPVTVTTTWSGTYSVAGGPALPVDGTATVTTPAVTLTAVATRAELVADPVG